MHEYILTPEVGKLFWNVDRLKMEHFSRTDFPKNVIELENYQSDLFAWPRCTMSVEKVEYSQAS